MFRKIVLFFIFVFCFSGLILAQGGGPGERLGRAPGGGSGKCKDSAQFADKNNQSFAILSRPQVPYTDAARTNNVQGTVVLKIVFLKTGKIGKIKVVKALPYGLTQRVIDGAKKICFRPKIVNGKAEDVVKDITYSFTIY